MSEIKSPLGNRKVQGSQMKSFDVPDFESEREFMMRANAAEQEYDRSKERLHVPSGLDNEEQLRELEAARLRRQQLLNKAPERLSPGAVERMNILLGLTTTNREVDLGNNVIFVLQSLKNKDIREVLLATSKFTGFESSFEMRRQYLARSIVRITDYDFETFISSNNLEDKLSFVDELDDGVANRLYDEFNILNNEVQSKYAVKNPEDAAEVAEHLKKS